MLYMTMASENVCAYMSLSVFVLVVRLRLILERTIRVCPVYRSGNMCICWSVVCSRRPYQCGHDDLTGDKENTNKSQGR